MSPNSDLPCRHFPRLKDYVYKLAGAYFVTICTYARKHLFGEVIDATMHLNGAGTIARTVWESLPSRFPGVSLDAWVIMPNHMHGILIITEAVPPYPLRGNTLFGEMIRTYKGATTRLVRVSGMSQFRWQQKYWQVIISSQRQLDTFRQYIINNPATWADDKLSAGGAHASPPPHPI